MRNEKKEKVAVRYFLGYTICGGVRCKVFCEILVTGIFYCLCKKHPTIKECKKTKINSNFLFWAINVLI